MSYFKQVQITDGTTPIEIETVDGNKYFGVSMLQDVHISAANSSIANLASGATFTGTSQDTLGFAAAQINIKTDQNCTVYIDQSMNGTDWDIIDSFTYYYTFGGNSWTVQMTAAYVRIRVTNNGASTTTYLRLQTAMCPVVEAIPRSLTLSGNLKTSIEEMLPTFGQGSKVKGSPMGNLKTTNHVKLTGSTFDGDTLDSNLWTTTTASGSATANVGTGQLTLTTGTTTASSIVINSVRSARYVGGTSNYFRGVVRLPAVTGINTRRFGSFDVNNGFFFSHNGTTLSVGARKETVDTTISSGSFNGDVGAVFSVDTNVHTYEIHYTNSSAWFIVDGVIIHKISAATAPSTSTLSLKIGLENTNGANTNNNALEIRVVTVQRLGELLCQPQYANISTSTTTILKRGAGILERIVINKSVNNVIVTIYDNTSAAGTIIGTITMTGTANGTLDYGGLPFNTGLTIVTTGGTPCNLTVIYE